MMPARVLALVLTKPPHTQSKRASEQADEELAPKRPQIRQRSHHEDLHHLYDGWLLFQRQKMTRAARSQDQALLVLLSLGEKSGTSGSLEDLPNAVVSLSRAFEVFVCANLLADFFALF